MGFLSKLTREITRPFKQTVKEVDRFLDRRVGIDDPTTRAITIAAGGALLGGVAGANIGSVLGSASTTGLWTVAGGVTGAKVGGTIGALAGAGLATSSLGRDESEDPTQITAMGLPSNLPLAAATGELKSLKAKQRERSRTNFTGGIKGGTGIAPTLKTI